MLRVIIAVVAFSASPFCSAADITYPHRSLETNEGYLLLDLLLERRVTEITLRADLRRKSGFKKPKHFEVKLGPYEPGRHLALIPLKKGWYVWAVTAVPHFDLPFRSDTSDDERWRFSIAEERINYVGQLVVRRERSRAAVSVDLLTRIAATQETLKLRFANDLELFPIRNAGYFKDHFFETYYQDPKDPAR